MVGERRSSAKSMYQDVSWNPVARVEPSPNLLMKSKPLFSWVAPGVTPQESLNISVAVQGFYRKVESMNADEVKRAFKDEILAMKEAMSEKGVVILEPRWFANFFK
ncbi:MAG: hypothetical protein A2659_03705 [Candidatus Yanofskybacteria bacterium RIFCSPHIGHO2_01_FULL_44_24]|nr:MAG: hypothetical protein A2659_03705 [Candidatus Yanofskybacteria bacterium RIFCSPHIGHO2_01_FULL_44_24]